MIANHTKENVKEARTPGLTSDTEKIKKKKEESMKTTIKTIEEATKKEKRERETKESKGGAEENMIATPDLTATSEGGS